MTRFRPKINIPIVARVIGWLLMIEAGFMLIPLATALFYHESSWLTFAITASVTAAFGLLLTWCIPSPRSHMGKREGFLLTALIWIVFSIFGMIPFMCGEHAMSLDSAFFEAMSGFTTTGCTTLDTIEHFPHSIKIWRCLMQWIGGMGIILFTLAVLPMLNHSGGMQMFNAEVTGITHDKIKPRISQTAKGLWSVYIVLTLLLIVALSVGPMDLFDALCHAFSTISTGGFSTRDDSLMYWNSTYVNIVTTIFMFLGGVNFALLYRLAFRDVKSLMRNDVWRVYIGVILICTIVFAVCVVVSGNYSGIQSVTIDPLFQVVSTITSTGLQSSSYESWGALVTAFMLLLMFSGACAGSTSGGAKIDRMLYLLKNTRNELYRVVHPNAVMSVRINNKIVPAELVNKVISYLCIYVMLMMLGGLILSAFGMPVIDALFSSCSCISNTGFGANITGVGNGFTQVPAAGKWVLSLLMLTGRLELFTVIVLFTPGFWRN